MAATMNDGRAEQLEQEIVGMKLGIIGLRRIIVGYGIIRNGRNCYGIVICNIFNFYHAIFPQANHGCDLLWKTS